MNKIKAIYRGGVWEIMEGSKWWTATSSTETAHIVSDNGRTIKPTSAMGKRVREAVTQAEKGKEQND